MSDFPAASRSAALALRDLFPETPLQRNEHLSKRYDADIWLKREDLTPVRSYKLRGAFTAMRKVLDVTPDRRAFVCASAGNLGLALAHSGARRGIPVTVVPKGGHDLGKAYVGPLLDRWLSGGAA